jgi:phosphatidylglycerol:prolipoprotein diacylglycerol transferase
MTFPVTFHVFGAAIPAHPVFELLGYTAGFQCYRIMRRRENAAEKLSPEVTVWLLGAAVMGAAQPTPVAQSAQSAPPEIGI